MTQTITVSELRFLAENYPSTALVLCRGLGVNIGELHRIAETGGITPDTIDPGAFAAAKGLCRPSTNHDWVAERFRELKRGRKPGTKIAAKMARLPDEFSPFQRDAIEVLSLTFKGAHNVPFQWHNVDWKFGRGISVCIPWRSLSTFDSDELTRLVFLCHDHRVRLEISGVSVRLMRLSMHPRTADGGIMERHPNLAEAVASHRTRFHEVEK